MVKALRIKDFPDYYATDNGDIYSRNLYHKTNPQCRIKKITLCRLPNGYMYVNLYKGTKQYKRYVHRLIAETFISNPENKPEVNHKNGNKTDNCIKNLEWVSKSENGLHKYRVLGCKTSKPIQGKLGKDCPNSKPILQIKDGKIIGNFYGAAEACRYTGIDKSHISACCRGRAKTAGGYQWKFK